MPRLSLPPILELILLLTLTLRLILDLILILSHPSALLYLLEILDSNKMPEQKPVIHCAAADVKTGSGQTEGMTRQTALGTSISPSFAPFTLPLSQMLTTHTLANSHTFPNALTPTPSLSLTLYLR